jgi:hypothetical protein
MEHAQHPHPFYERSVTAKTLLSLSDIENTRNIDGLIIGLATNRSQRTLNVFAQ